MVWKRGTNLDDVKEKQKNRRLHKITQVTQNSKNKGAVIGENSRLMDEVENDEKKKIRSGSKGRKKLQEKYVCNEDDKENCDYEKEIENLNRLIQTDSCRFSFLIQILHLFLIMTKF